MDKRDLGKDSNEKEKKAKKLLQKLESYLEHLKATIKVAKKEINDND